MMKPAIGAGFSVLHSKMQGLPKMVLVMHNKTQDIVVFA